MPSSTLGASQVLCAVLSRLSVNYLRSRGASEAAAVVASVVDDESVIDLVARTGQLSRQEARRWLAETQALLSLVPCDGVNYEALHDRVMTLFWLIRDIPETIQHGFDPGSD